MIFICWNGIQNEACQDQVNMCLTKLVNTVEVDTSYFEKSMKQEPVKSRGYMMWVVLSQKLTTGGLIWHLRNIICQNSDSVMTIINSSKTATNKTPTSNTSTFKNFLIPSLTIKTLNTEFYDIESEKE